jgi:hypothetical protein
MRKNTIVGTLILAGGLGWPVSGKPQLLINPDPGARRVSDGCICLDNENVRELMQMVDVGTPVIIY